MILHLLQYKKRVSRKLLFSMLSCIVLLAVAAAVQAFRYGMSLIDFSVGISMIIMFIVTMTELNQEMYQLISREGKIKERLEIATILNKCIAELISGEDEDAAISICCVLSAGILTEIAVILFRSMKRGMSVQIPMSMP